METMMEEKHSFSELLEIKSWQNQTSFWDYKPHTSWPFQPDFQTSPLHATKSKAVLNVLESWTIRRKAWAVPVPRTTYPSLLFITVFIHQHWLSSMVWINKQTEEAQNQTRTMFSSNVIISRVCEVLGYAKVALSFLISRKCVCQKQRELTVMQSVLELQEFEVWRVTWGERRVH